MKWLEIPIEELKQFDKDWEVRRKNVDETKALLHEEIYNELVPPIMLLSEDTEVQVSYPYPLHDSNELDILLNTEEWSREEGGELN